jgi:hypothetical protein
MINAGYDAVSFSDHDLRICRAVWHPAGSSGSTFGSVVMTIICFTMP